MGSGGVIRPRRGSIESRYVREAAVRRLEEKDAPYGPWFVIVRANDWVEPVRELELPFGGGRPFVR